MNRADMSLQPARTPSCRLSGVSGTSPISCRYMPLHLDSMTDHIVTDQSSVQPLEARSRNRARAIRLSSQKVPFSSDFPTCCQTWCAP